MTERIRGLLAPVVTPFDASLRPDAKRLLRHCGGAVAGLGTRGVRHELRGELAVGRRAHRASRCPLSRRNTDATDDARHGMLRDHRFDPPYLVRGAPRRCRLPDAAAVLLQGSHRRRFVPEFATIIDAVATHGCASICTTSLRCAGGHQLRTDRATAEGLPGTVAGIKDSSATGTTRGNSSRGLRIQDSNVFAAANHSCCLTCVPVVSAASVPPQM